MFDFLTQSTVTDAFPAGHHALQFVMQWAAAALRSGRPASIIDLPESQANLARRIVQEIEDREGIPVTELAPPKVDEYIRSLSNRMQEMSRQQFHVDLDKGRSLLDELRSTES